MLQRFVRRLRAGLAPASRRQSARRSRLLGVETLEDRVVPATAVWTGPATGGTWYPSTTNPFAADSNWSTGVAPSSSDTAVIPGGITLTYNTPTVPAPNAGVASLVLGDGVSGHTTIVLPSGPFDTGSVTLCNSTIQIGSSTWADLVLGCWDTSANISGTGDILFGAATANQLTSAGPAPLEIGNNILVHGQNGRILSYAPLGQVGMENYGTISADVPGGKLIMENASSLSVAPGSNGQLVKTYSSGPIWNNYGTVQAINGGQIELRGCYSNSGGPNFVGDPQPAGIFGVGPGSTFTMNYFYDATGGIGNWQNTGGTVNLIGTVVLGTGASMGATLELDNNTGRWDSIGGTVEGGSIAAGPSKLLVQSSLQLNNGIRLDGSALDVSASGAFVTVGNDLILNGGLQLGARGNTNGNGLLFNGAGNQALTTDGDSIVTFTVTSPTGSTNSFSKLNTGTLTIGPNVLVHGGTIAGRGNMENKGIIRADVSGTTFTLGYGGIGIVTNDAGGLLIATNGGLLTINVPYNGTMSSAGMIEADAGSRVTINGSLMQTGAIDITLNSSTSPGLVISGAATLSGALTISLAFQPGSGPIDVISYSSQTNSSLAETDPPGWDGVWNTGLLVLEPK